MSGPREGNLRRRRLRSPRAKRCSGAEMLEFIITFLPMLVMVFYLLDVSWAIFAKSTLQRAVRIGVRTGVTLTNQQMPTGGCLTDVVKATVQQNALGMLNGASGAAMIKVNYFLPPDAKSTGGVTDVSTQTNGNAPGNIMQVSVQGFSLIPLLPRIFDWKHAADKSPLSIEVYSADLIEPSRNPPCIGTAP